MREVRDQNSYVKRKFTSYQMLLWGDDGQRISMPLSKFVLMKNIDFKYASWGG